MNRFLIVGLGNVGSEYVGTRHNIGFEIIDAFAQSLGVGFEDARYGAVSTCSLKNVVLTLLKPSTFMNLSGKAVRYWLDQTKIDLSHLLVLVDDVNLPFGQTRLRKQGSAGGHNGLKNIELMLNTNLYARLRFGIGNDYPRGQQINYVLDHWTDEQAKQIVSILPTTNDIIRSFCLAGIDKTMNLFNR